MRRRAFLSVVCGAVAWPLAAAAQQSTNSKRLAIFSPSDPSADLHEHGSKFYRALFAELRRLGQIEGQNLTVEMSGRAPPTFLELLGPKDYRTSSVLAIIHGLALVVTIVIGTETALGLVFDPREKDFPFAALTMAAVPFATMSLLNRPKKGIRPMAESIFAGLFLVAAIYTGLNEGPDNWQSLWTCAAYLLLALTLWRART
jgi:hypothetical protein